MADVSFSEKVYSLLGKVPRGKVTTYSALARAAGRPGAARAVGTLMRKNARPEEIPCYRVVRSDGSVGEYSGKGGAPGKAAMLKKDGLWIIGRKISSLGSFLFRF